MQSRPKERHFTQRVGWLRAAVLGANDGIVSTASLLIGVAAAASATTDIVITGIAGLVAGSLSMAAGEYVSVSSQADTEQADIEREKKHLESDIEYEREELATIYVKRGLDRNLARMVALQLMEHDALSAHARDELGISHTHSAQPILAALTSAATFALGAAMPLLAAVISPKSLIIPIVGGSSIVFLSLLGRWGASAGGAPVQKATLRVAFWGALAMALTAGVGALVGAAV